MTDDPRRDLDLHRFLLRVFTAEEVLRFTRDTFGQAVYHEVARTPSDAGLMDEIVAVWSRFGCIGEPLFVNLLRRFPALTDAILELAGQWCPAVAVAGFVRTIRSAERGDTETVADDLGPRVGLTCRLARDCLGWERGEEGEFRRTGESFTDPCLDVTILNRDDDALLVTAIGIFVEGLRHPALAPPGEDEPLTFVSNPCRPDKISVFDVIGLDIPTFSPLQRRAEVAYQAQHDRVHRAFFAELEDPVLLPQDAPLRYKLALPGLMIGRSICADIRWMVRTDRGTVRSPPLTLCT